MEQVLHSAIIFVLIFGILGIVYLFRDSSFPPMVKEGFKGGVDYSTYPKNESVDTYTGAFIGNNSNLECSRVWGYNGLFCNPNGSGSRDKIDPFYGTSSSTTCEGSGIQKGSGNVCLSAEQRRLLTTRGGNATTGNGM